MFRLHWRRVRSRYPWLQMIQTWRFWLLIIFTIILITYAVLSYGKGPETFMEEEIKEVWLGNIQIDFRTGLIVMQENKQVFLRGTILDSQQMKGHPNHCGKYNASESLCAEWYPYVKLEVTNSVDEHASCQSFVWSTFNGHLGSKYLPQTCLSMADFQWYGGSLLSRQTWPLNKAAVNMQPYVAHDLKRSKGEGTVFGNVLDWFWINSAGVAMMLDSTVPVQVSVNQSNSKLLCFYSTPNKSPALKYKLCKAGNLRKIHRYATSKMVHLPVQLPKDGYFTDPLWSSDPMINNPSQGILLNYAQNISDQSLGRHSLEVFDDSVSLYNPDYFDKHKYPNLQQMMMAIHEYKFETVVPVTPFVKETEKIDSSKLLKDLRGKPMIVNQNGDSWNILNLLDETVYGEITEISTGLKELLGFTGLRFVGTEMDYLPQETFSITKRSKYVDKILGIADLLKVSTITTSVGRSQRFAPLVKLSSPFSSWNGDGGMQSVVPSVLTLGMMGYPFVIPNIVGGPGRNRKINDTFAEILKPDRELYIRWMGVAAYMPCMMFSFPPWLYDKDVVAMAHDFIKIHKEVVSPLVIKAAREYEISGSPIVRPLWWIDPTDKNLESIGDQYLIGDTLLVAPILQPGKTARDIFIPTGRWRDNLNAKDLDGRTRLANYEIPLNKVATFSKIPV